MMYFSETPLLLTRLTVVQPEKFNSAVSAQLKETIFQKVVNFKKEKSFFLHCSSNSTKQLERKRVKTEMNDM